MRQLQTVLLASRNRKTAGALEKLAALLAEERVLGRSAPHLRRRVRESAALKQQLDFKARVERTTLNLTSECCCGACRGVRLPWLEAPEADQVACPYVYTHV